MSEKIKDFMVRHPSPDVLGVHPIAFSRKTMKSLNCKNVKWSSLLCLGCDDYEKQSLACYEEAEEEEAQKSDV
jgi:hypothetical protein